MLPVNQVFRMGELRKRLLWSGTEQAVWIDIDFDTALPEPIQVAELEQLLIDRELECIDDPFEETVLREVEDGSLDQQKRDELWEMLAEVVQARIPLISNITGHLLTEYEYKNPIYWADHLLKTVQFSKSIQTLRELGVRTFVEVGHGFAMKHLIQSNWGGKSVDPVRIVPALGAVEEEYQSFLSVIAAYWTLSGTLELTHFVEGKRNAVLPAYPFEKTRHWIDPVIGFRPRGEAAGTATACPVVVPPASVARAEPVPSKPQAMNEANPVEAIVSGIYASYLGEGVDPAMSFFDLGGNSLIAIQMINKLRETFNLDIPLRGFYDNSSVTAMSLQIAEQLLEDEVEHV